jgi:ribosomal protein S19E (S16A)
MENNTFNAGVDSLLNKKVFIRTITQYFTGELVGFDNLFLHLKKASWIAETDQWSKCVKDGALNEAEPYAPDTTVYISIASLIDMFEWVGDLSVQINKKSK